MRKTPCQMTKISLRSSTTAAVECNCCGLWEKEKRTNAHRELQLFAVNALTRKAVRL